LLTDAFKDGSFNPEKFETIDIHTGGEDNRFPHHECEIAQTQGATGKKYVNYWLHVTHLVVDGGKMAKSKGTFHTVSGLMAEGFSWRAIRYLLLSTHYRSPLNFSKEGLKSAQVSLDRFDELFRKLDLVKTDCPYNESLAGYYNDLKLVVERELNNDLNISGALGALFEFVRKTNSALQSQSLNIHQAKEIIEQFFSFNKIFAFFDKEILAVKDISPELVDLLESRKLAREQKNWAESDSLRDLLKEKGLVVRDTSNGQEW